MVKTATLRGVKYDIDLCGSLDGCCDSPRGGRPSIRVMVPLDTKRGFITVLHEAPHAEGWSKSEAIVDRTSREIGTLMWRLGYRLQS